MAVPADTCAAATAELTGPGVADVRADPVVGAVDLLVRVAVAAGACIAGTADVTGVTGATGFAAIATAVARVVGSALSGFGEVSAEGLLPASGAGDPDPLTAPPTVKSTSEATARTAPAFREAMCAQRIRPTISAQIPTTAPKAPSSTSTAPTRSPDLN
jgi:hypothetical protein